MAAFTIWSARNALLVFDRMFTVRGDPCNRGGRVPRGLYLPHLEVKKEHQLLLKGSAWFGRVGGTNAYKTAYKSMLPLTHEL